jgi:hypothetical protein
VHYGSFCGTCVVFPLLIQQNVDGSNLFNRTWAEFKAGFGDPSGNYWLGNEQLHQLTKDNEYKLHFDLQSYNTGLWYVAEYSTFTVASEADNYRLNVTGFSGNASNNALGYQNGMMFSTKDRDNDDMSGSHCAEVKGYGFWHKGCSNCGVNSRTGSSFFWYYLPGDWKLRTSRMWLVSRYSSQRWPF